MNAPLPTSALHTVQAADLAALPMIEKWVSFASVSRDSNLSVIEWTYELLKAQGVDCKLSYDKCFFIAAFL